MSEIEGERRVKKTIEQRHEKASDDEQWITPRAAKADFYRGNATPGASDSSGPSAEEISSSA